MRSTTHRTTTVSYTHLEGAFEKMSLTNLAGDEIDKTIFEGHDLTVINVWATSCKPCLSEMPELAKLSDEYEQNGGQVQIIGLCTDLVDMDANRVDSQIELANQIVELTGADYTHLVPDDEMLNFLMENIIGVPTTFFVDSQGKEVGESVIGARDQAAWPVSYTHLDVYKRQVWKSLWQPAR